MINRRKALAGFGSLAAVSALAQQNISKQNPGPKLFGEAPGRIAPREDMANVLEFEDVASRMLASPAYAPIAGGDRTYFDRITLRPRMMISTLEMDMSVDLFGQKMFAPIIVGPIARQQQFHPEGELATARGASAAKAVMVASSDLQFSHRQDRSRGQSRLVVPGLPECDAERRKSPNSASGEGRLQGRMHYGRRRVSQCQARFRSRATGENGASRAELECDRSTAPGPFRAVHIERHHDRQRKPTPLSNMAVQGIVVSDYGSLLTKGMAPAIEVLPSIVDAVGGRVPVLVDGSFRRGSDIFKALAFGATAVYDRTPGHVGFGRVRRGRCAVGSRDVPDGVGRDLGPCGTPTLKAISRAHVKVHQA